jgi:ribosomal protein S18 acetylase RimI-like enzyme
MDDALFLRRLFASTREAELSALAWSPGQIETFLQLQLEAQERYYRTHYPHARFDVIERAGTPVGRLVVDRSGGVIHVVDIAFLPDARGAGHGSELLRRLQEEAAAQGRAVMLRVARTNPALRLYSRLGFRVVHEGEIYVGLEWHPGTRLSLESQPKTAS